MQKLFLVEQEIQNCSSWPRGMFGNYSSQEYAETNTHIVGECSVTTHRSLKNNWELILVLWEYSDTGSHFPGSIHTLPSISGEYSDGIRHVSGNVQKLVLVYQENVHSFQRVIFRNWFSYVNLGNITHLVFQGNIQQRVIMSHPRTTLRKHSSGVHENIPKFSLHPRTIFKNCL